MSSRAPRFHYPPVPTSDALSVDSSASSSSSHEASPQLRGLPTHLQPPNSRGSDDSSNYNALVITVPSTPSHFRDFSPTAHPDVPLSPAAPFTPRLHHAPLVHAEESQEPSLTTAERSDLFDALAEQQPQVTREGLTRALLAEAIALRMESAPAAVDTLVHHLWSMPSQRTLPSSLPASTFDALSQHWRVPSQELATEALDAKSRVYESQLPIGRRLLAHWSVEGPMSTFVILVVWLQTALGIYYFVHYARNELRDELGWGLPFAKMGAGVLYPTIALLLLSSCRRLATFLRQWSLLSRFVNWDRSQLFHAYVGVTVLIFATIHALSHLGGTFHQAAAHADSPSLANFPQPLTYRAMVGSRAGVTGLIAFGILLLIVTTSQSRVRRLRFELFQYSHLLIWPFIGLLLAHGTGKLISSPILGYWLIVPLLCVLWDRVPRTVQMFRPVAGASFNLLKDNTVVLSIPQAAVGWQYKPGQYLLVRIQELSYWQWHPFTMVGSSQESPVSGMAGHVYMRSVGDWTEALLKRCKAGQKMTVTLDGPFGSPSESLSKYSSIVIVGTGIGVTPYAGWLRDISPSQTVHFHWVVRQQISFTWFSALLNALHVRPDATARIKVHTYATGLAPTSTVQYVLRVLLEKHRTISHSTSYVTGLECETKYGRPVIASIFEGVVASREEGDLKPGGAAVGSTDALDNSIGVFYCGPNYLGMEISDRCRMETSRTGVRWEFVGEVF